VSTCAGYERERMGYPAIPHIHIPPHYRICADVPTPPPDMRRGAQTPHRICTEVPTPPTGYAPICPEVPTTRVNGRQSMMLLYHIRLQAVTCRLYPTSQIDAYQITEYRAVATAFKHRENNLPRRAAAFEHRESTLLQLSVVDDGPQAVAGVQGVDGLGGGSGHVGPLAAGSLRTSTRTEIGA
jgi:hypothetical protein